MAVLSGSAKRRRIVTILVVAATLPACSSTSDAEVETEAGVEDDCPHDYEGFDAASPPVSFDRDVMPIVQTFCANQFCHDNEMESPGDLYLGIHITEGEADAALRAQVRTNLLTPSTIALDLPRVAPGDPRASFLMLKLDGCQNAAGLRCNEQLTSACGERMPFAATKLGAAERDIFRRWIAQGAGDG